MSSSSPTPAAASTAPGSAPTATSSANTDGAERPLVMQIIMDRTILKATPEWSRGALIAQGAHAAVAVITETLHEAETRAYVHPDVLGSMHKIVLQSPKSGTLADLSQKLHEAYGAEVKEAEEAGRELGMRFPRHHLWIEQPEGVPTAIAIAPNRKPPALKKILDKCSLLRD